MDRTQSSMVEKVAKAISVDAVSKVAAEKVEKAKAATLLMNGKKKILMTPIIRVKANAALAAAAKARAKVKAGEPTKDQKAKAKAKEKDSEGKEKDKARIPLSLPRQL